MKKDIFHLVPLEKENTFLIPKNYQCLLEIKNLLKHKKYGELYSNRDKYKDLSLLELQYLLYENIIDYNQNNIINLYELIAYISQGNLLYSFWMALLSEYPNHLYKLSKHQIISSYIYIDMPCPNVTVDDYNNVKKEFNYWISNQNKMWIKITRNIIKHNWKSKLIQQPKYYFLIPTPSIEQAIFIILQQKQIVDIDTISKNYPDFKNFYNGIKSIASNKDDEIRLLREFFKDSNNLNIIDHVQY